MLGQGWPQKKSALYLKLGQWWINYDEFYSETGSVQKLNRTRSFGSTSIYAEYGVTNRLTAIVYFPFFSKATIYKQVNAYTGAVIQEGEKLSALGDTNVAVKYGVPLPNNIYVSTSLTLGFPTGVYPEEEISSTSLQTGDGEFNQMLTLGVASSISLGQYFPYFSLSGGFNNRTEGYSDEWRVLFEAGIKIRGFTFLFKTDMVETLRNGTFNENLVGSNLIGNNTEYMRLSPELIWNINDQFGLTASLFKPVSGTSFFSETYYAIGIVWKTQSE